MATRCWIASVMVGIVLVATQASHPVHGDPLGGSKESASAILASQRAVREEMTSSYGKYARLPGNVKSAIRGHQDRVEALLGGVSNVSELAPADRERLMAELAGIERVIADNRGDHQVCWRERRTGSAMATKVCATQAEREQLTEDSRAWKSKPGVCMPSGVKGAPSCGQIGE